MYKRRVFYLECVLEQLTVVRKAALEWPAEITDEQKQTALAELKEKFIIAR
ncbi:hypothetical protein H0A36_30905 [Endozoicomonas sp. SM1973]|uniref:Uncharacterized protein n=1 Tax=Spartinivicinus marinus TaxID=2994442 RepID=A0A853IN35_9GAMM|nr:head decoration protein [Spartinivicinus marinus]NYZ70425.1 hypothetical protein [Spartinivicinus marinus]